MGTAAHRRAIRHADAQSGAWHRVEPRFCGKTPMRSAPGKARAATPGAGTAAILSAALNVQHPRGDRTAHGAYSFDAGGNRYEATIGLRQAGTRGVSRDA